MRTANLATGDELVFVATSAGTVEYKWTPDPAAPMSLVIRDAIAHRDRLVDVLRARVRDLEREVLVLESQIVPMLPEDLL